MNSLAATELSPAIFLEKNPVVTGAMNLAIGKAAKDPLIPSFETRVKKEAPEGAFELGQPLLRRCDAIGLHMQP